MATPITITTDARRFESEDNCLAAAGRELAEALGLDGWDLHVAWGDPGRETITAQVYEDTFDAADLPPAWRRPSTTAENITHHQLAALRAEARQAGDREQVALCDRALAGDAAAIDACAEAIASAQAMIR